MLRLNLWMLLAAAAAWGDDGQRVVRVDHYVPVKSIAPSMAGQTAQVYVREVVQTGVGLRNGAGERAPVVLFIHGAGTPAEVAFDVPYQDYSWMAYLAKAGYDVFSMDMTGYGRSTRPALMNDQRNLSKEQQAQFRATPCAVGEARVTTMESDWHDIGTVVDYVRSLRGVAKVNLVGWSQGGPRAGGYAAKNPDKVGRLVLLAPAYFSGRPTGAPPAGAMNRQAPFNTQSRADLDANWDRQVGCPEQFDMAAREAVWADMLASDPVGATWGTGVRRAPNVGGGSDGWNKQVVGAMKTPLLVVGAALDKQALPERVRALHADYGAAEKVYLDLGCASHNALWERNHLLLFAASLEWFTKGTVNGANNGEVRVGYRDQK
ncbi:MAG: alpha/beta fold hydrolase [Bryobacterales bacterium]|nr:alpha/beta fold hydrolase [Bryobacterales bacterium]